MKAYHVGAEYGEGTMSQYTFLPLANAVLSLLNSWPLWAVEASEYSPLLSVVSELDGFWQCTSLW